jgi:hypothetical protein
MPAAHANVRLAFSSGMRFVGAGCYPINMMCVGRILSAWSFLTTIQRHRLITRQQARDWLFGQRPCLETEAGPFLFVALAVCGEHIVRMWMRYD